VANCAVMAKRENTMEPNTLLLVEDESLILGMLESELTEAGFKVVTANTGAQAFAELDDGATELRAVITDIKLGAGADGWQVSRRARELVPEMPILYLTGDSAQEWSSRGVPGSVLIAKPFVLAQVVTALATLLNEADQRHAAMGGD